MKVILLAVLGLVAVSTADSETYWPTGTPTRLPTSRKDANKNSETHWPTGTPTRSPTSRKDAKNKSKTVVCPGFSKKTNTQCDCEGDCEEMADSWCGCDQARKKSCCGERASGRPHSGIPTMTPTMKPTQKPVSGGVTPEPTPRLPNTPFPTMTPTTPGDVSDAPSKVPTIMPTSAPGSSGKPTAMCMGEISSMNARCNPIKSKAACQKEGQSVFSDGLCIWKGKAPTWRPTSSPVSSAWGSGVWIVAESWKLSCTNACQKQTKGGTCNAAKLNSIDSRKAFSDAVGTIGETATSLCGGEWFGGYSDAANAPMAMEGECGYLDAGKTTSCDGVGENEHWGRRVCFCDLPSEPNCMTKERWSEEKTAWCCENKNLGCPGGDGSDAPSKVPTIMPTSAPGSSGGDVSYAPSMVPTIMPTSAPGSSVERLCEDEEAIMTGRKLKGKASTSKVATLCDCEDLCRAGDGWGISFKPHKKKPQKSKCFCYIRLPRKFKDKKSKTYQSINFMA